MRARDKFRLRLRSLFRRRHVERELDDELRFHLDQLVEEKIAAGVAASRGPPVGVANDGTHYAISGGMPRYAPREFHR